VFAVLDVIGEHVLNSERNSTGHFSADDGDGRAGSNKFEEQVAKAAIRDGKDVLIQQCNDALPDQKMKLVAIDAPPAKDESSRRLVADITLHFEVVDDQDVLNISVPANIKFTKGSARDNTAGKEALFKHILVGRRHSKKKCSIGDLIVLGREYLQQTEPCPVFRDYFFLYFKKDSAKNALRAAKAAAASSILTQQWSTPAPPNADYTFNENQGFPHVQLRYPTHQPYISESLLQAQTSYISWVLGNLTISALKTLGHLGHLPATGYGVMLANLEHGSVRSGVVELAGPLEDACLPTHLQ
jgi:hypothetical protein